MIFGDILKGVFGDKGLAGGVLDVLKSTGVIKDPAQIQAAQEALMKFELEHGAQDVKLEEIAAGDRKSSRDMQIAALAQDDVFAKRFIYWYAAIITLATMIYIACISFMTIPKENLRFVDTVLGFLMGTVVASIITYFFGSSHSSAKKNDIIARMEMK